MKIAVIGTGRVGRAIGGGLIAAGHEVAYGSRDPDAAIDLPAPAANPMTAVDRADVVVDAVPGGTVLEALESIGADAIADKVLMEVANAIAPGFVLAFPNGSLGAEIQSRYPRTRVVKTLNTVQAPLMDHPASLPAASTVFLAGNDPDAKAVVATLLTHLGWPREWQLDLGDISQARATEHYIFLSFGIATSLATTNVNISVVR